MTRRRLQMLWPKTGHVFESPRSITPPMRTLSDDGLLVGSNHQILSYTMLGNLYSSSHDEKTKAKPLWMKAETMIRDTSMTPTRQRQIPPPPESPLASKGRIMLQHQRKLERSSGHDSSGFGMLDAVQRRRRKHFQKCEKAATEIQRMALGWLASSHLENRRLKGHKQKDNDKKNRMEKNGKKVKDVKAKKSEETGRDASLSPKNFELPPVKPTLTAMESAMRKSLRRLGASQRDIMTSTSQSDLFSSSFVKGRQRDLMNKASVPGPSNSTPEQQLLSQPEDVDFEQNLCNMFRSNIANVTARARRRSIHG